ncbi:hypothetical protein [Vibrio phage vB_pir03]|nr:hypothetical protein [Vibrio phage vB_pir03]
MSTQNKLRVIKNTFPRIQYFNETTEINAALFNSIRHYVTKELGEAYDVILHEGTEWLVSDHVAVRFPYDITVNDVNLVTSCGGFKVYIGGQGGTGKRDEIRRYIQNIVVQTFAD